MKRMTFAGILLFVVMIFSGCANTGNSQSGQQAVDRSTGYDFSVKTVDGKLIRLSDFKGKVVLVQFFGTFCPPCRMEMPFLDELGKKYKGKVVVIGLSIDYMGEDSSALKEFVRSVGISYPVGASDEKTWNMYANRIAKDDAIPQTYVLDKNGKVRYYEVGFSPQYASLFEAAVEKLLKE